jgi:hypothetical protein
MVPSQLPTEKPTEAFGENGGEPTCMDAWVWCPGHHSVCFADPTFNGDMPGEGWGWAIEYSEENCGQCQIWVNSDCDRETGTMVGTATFSRHEATFQLFDGWSSTSASLYGGKCEGSDGGDAVMNECGCKSDMVEEFANDYEMFPIHKTFDSSVSDYAFTSNDSSTFAWGGDYAVFPLGDRSPDYVSMHMQVCPCHLHT